MKSNYFDGNILMHCKKCWRDVPVEDGVITQGTGDDFICNECLKRFDPDNPLFDAVFGDSE